MDSRSIFATKIIHSSWRRQRERVEDHDDDDNEEEDNHTRARRCSYATVIAASVPSILQ
jgi:hypothetical protein